MEKIWIDKMGTCEETEIQIQLEPYEKFARPFIAMYTDHFSAGNYDDIGKLEDVTKLLELRVFCEEEELLFRRSRIGNVFQWRLASDQARTNNFAIGKKEKKCGLPEEEDMTFYIRNQILDINQKLSFQESLGETPMLYTTGGGRYTLPIGMEHNVVKVMSYLLYDENGMATVSDFRLCGFGTMRKEEVLG